MTVAIGLALLCAPQCASVLGADLEPGCQNDELSDSPIDETALVQTKIQEHRRQTMLYGSKLRGLARLSDAVERAVGRLKEGGTDTSGYTGTFCISAIIMFIFGYFYNQHVIEGPPPFPKVSSHRAGPRVGLFDCCKDANTCLHVCFCMPIVAAKNYHATGVCDFWPGCVVAFTSTYTPFWCISVLIRAVLSVRVKEKMGLEYSFLWACIVSIFCLPCDVGRESLEIDREAGADIECCCTVNYAAPAEVQVQN